MPEAGGGDPVNPASVRTVVVAGFKRDFERCGLSWEALAKCRVCGQECALRDRQDPDAPVGCLRCAAAGKLDLAPIDQLNACASFYTLFGRYVDQPPRVLGMKKWNLQFPQDIRFCTHHDRSDYFSMMANILWIDPTRPGARPVGVGRFLAPQSFCRPCTELLGPQFTGPILDSCTSIDGAIPDELRVVITWMTRSQVGALLERREPPTVYAPGRG